MHVDCPIWHDAFANCIVDGISASLLMMPEHRPAWVDYVLVWNKAEARCDPLFSAVTDMSVRIWGVGYSDCGRLSCFAGQGHVPWIETCGYRSGRGI